MSNLNHLAEVIATEAELTEQLVAIMKQQQEALVKTDADAIASTVDRQEELLLPIEGLEQERARLTKEVWNEVASTKIVDDASVSLTMLVNHLNDEEATRLSTVGGRLHSAVKEMTSVNQANQYLIDHSRKFVRETFRIVTNGFSRKLVDHKI
jgi:flagellar biosynthesis/type III secretory pathway chaperone